MAIRFLVKSALQWFIVSNVNVALAAGMLCFACAKRNELPTPEWYGVLLFLLTFSVYNLQRIIDQNGFHPEDVAFWEAKKKGVLFVSLTSFILALIIGVKLIHFNAQVLIFGGVFAFICWWYTAPVLGVKLREVPGVKIVVISLTWVATVLVFPLVNEGLFSQNVVVELMVLLVFITATILPFDIRDVNTDNLTQSTIPQRIGVKKTKLLGTFLFVLTAFIAILMGFISVENGWFYLTILLEIILLLKANSKQSIIFFGLVDFGILLFALSICLN